jgi:hypothetical protein
MKKMLKALALIGFMTGASAANAAFYVQSLSASNVTATSATLHATVQNTSGSYTQDVDFKANTVLDGNGQPSGGIVSGIITVPQSVNGYAISAPITGLACGTTYHYNVNWFGAFWGGAGPVTFTTAACPVAEPPVATPQAYQLRTRYRGVRAVAQ